MILEIGSGSLATHKFLKNLDVVHIDITKHGFHLENVCDTHYLPFRNESFDTVFISHVLEHCYNPSKVLSEIKRVCVKKAIIVIPNSDFYKNIAECDEHIYSWNFNTFYNLLSKFFSSVEVEKKFKVRESPNKIKRVLSYAFALVLLKLIKEENDLIAVCLK